MTSPTTREVTTGRLGQPGFSTEPDPPTPGSADRLGWAMAALVAAPLLVGIGDLLAGPESSTDGGMLADVAAHPERFWLSRLVFFAGMAMLLPGVTALQRLAAARGRRLVTLAAVLTGIGAMGYGGGELSLGLTLPALVDPAIPRAAAVLAYHRAQADAVESIPFLLGLFAYLGLALAGVALLRSRAVGGWLGWSLVVAPLLWFVGAMGTFRFGALGSVPLLAVYAWLAATWRASRRVP
jgi:uncharacterized protein DUF4386